MTGLGLMVGALFIALSIDRMTDKLCEMLKNITINFGSIRIVRDNKSGDGEVGK